MSKKTILLEITPPDSLDLKNGEIHCFKGIKCVKCNGKGGSYHGGWQEKFKKNLDDPDWVPCPVCRGTGELEAKAVIGWVPYGEVKERFK